MRQHWNGYQTCCECEICSRIRRGRAHRAVSKEKWTSYDMIGFVGFVMVATLICIYL